MRRNAMQRRTTLLDLLELSVHIPVDSGHVLIFMISMINGLRYLLLDHSLTIRVLINCWFVLA